MGVGILIGYFAKHEEARKAHRELARQGFSRTALAHKGTDGDVHITDPFLWRRARGATLAAILFGGIAGMATLPRHWSQSLPFRSMSTSLTLILVCATLVAMLAFFGLGCSTYGVEPEVLRDHTRWLVSGESVLILRGPIESLPLPVALLRESSDITPVLCPV